MNKIKKYLLAKDILGPSRPFVSCLRCLYAFFHAGVIIFLLYLGFSR